MPGHEFRVEDLKTRLDKYLATHLPGTSRGRIQRDIELGRVSVNSHRVLQSKFAVKKGDRVIYHPSATKEEQLKPANILLEVLYDNHGLLVIDKPAGLAVHPGAGFRGNSLASALLYYFKDIKEVGEQHRPGIVHRLDKETSGVMLIAKTPQMYEYLRNAFAQKLVKKEYLALVIGRLENKHGVIDLPIGKSKKDFRKFDVKEAENLKEALTEYQVLETLNDPKTLDPFGKLRVNPEHSRGVDEYTLVRVKLHTGRTHQIRVHFKSLGHPLAGDSLYGSRTVKPEGLRRQFLHAKKIEVRLPDGTWIEAESELADDLRRVLLSLNSKVVKSL